MAIRDLVAALVTGAAAAQGETARDASPPDSSGEVLAVVYECRRCGTTVTADARRCPHCDSETIAEYPVE